MIVFIAAILPIFHMILIENRNLLNLQEFKSFERKVARTRVFKGRDVVDKVMEESIPLSRVGGPPLPLTALVSDLLHFPLTDFQALQTFTQFPLMSQAQNLQASLALAQARRSR